MSIFSQDLDKGGTLRDVINYKGFSYANGTSIHFDISACETVNPIDMRDDFIFANFPEFDRDSYWPLYPDGFMCNRGKMEYSQIFSREFQDRHYIMAVPYLDAVARAAMEGHIETLFVPYAPSWSWEFERSRRLLTDHPEFENRLIRDTEWWKLVGEAIKEGVQNALDPKLNAKVFVTRFDRGWSDSDWSRTSFFITLKIYGHEDLGGIYWPLDDDIDLPGQLFELENGIPTVHSKCGRPISISTRIDLQYKGYPEKTKD